MQWFQSFLRRKQIPDPFDELVLFQTHKAEAVSSD